VEASAALAQEASGSAGRVQAESDASATLTYTPTPTIPVTLTVRSGDRAGNSSSATTYRFRVSPANAPTVSSTVYPPDAPGGGVGVPGEFTSGVNGVSDATVFRYQLNSEPAQDVPVVSVDGTATVTIMPTQAGANVLSVSSFNAAGIRLASKAYDFTVRE
jgi:hypothetical protein